MCWIPAAVTCTNINKLMLHFQQVTQALFSHLFLLPPSPAQWLTHFNVKKTRSRL